MEHERGGMRADQDAPERAAPIRVALVGCSGVLGDIIRRAVREAPDMRVVSEAPDFSVPGDAQAEPSPEVDVVLWNNADEEQLERLLADAAVGQQPVLTALDDGRQAVLWRLAPHRTSLGVLSPASLVEWIRSAAGH
jgi:hypothetical protein